MMKCFVSSCNTDFHGYVYENENPPEKFSAHRLPGDPIRRLKWLQAIAKAENTKLILDEINVKSIRVCSKHFRLEDYALKNGRWFLTKTAVPVLFESYKETVMYVKRNISEFRSKLMKVFYSLHEESGSDDLQERHLYISNNPTQIRSSVLKRSFLEDSGLGDTEQVMPPPPKRKRYIHKIGTCLRVMKRSHF